MKKKKNLDGVKSAIRGLEGLAEIAILVASYYYIWRHDYAAGTFPAYYGYGKYVLTGVYALLVTVLFFNFDGFKFGYLRLSDVMISQCIALFIANFITYWQLCLIANAVIGPVPMLLMMAVDIVIVFVCTYCYSVVYHRIYVPKKMVLIFGSEDAIGLKFKMDMRSDKYKICKLISEEEGLARICQQIVNYDAVVISDISAQTRNDILKFCYKNRIRAYVAPKISDIIIRGAKSIDLFDTPLLLVKGKGLTMLQRVYKRAFDIVVCALAMVVAAPIMLVVAAAIKIEDGGPAFYTQKRVSLNGRVFSILKFRSMVVDAEKEGHSIPATDNDPRITKVGKFIRASRLDELPQLLNILKGDMSIVGPRPERVEHVEKYGRDIPEFDFRLKVKGGLTGYAQIYGRYNTSPYDKLRLDLMYIENYSFMLDIKLILMTLRVMLKKESTEGFDKAEELERLKQETLERIQKEKTEEELVASGK